MKKSIIFLSFFLLTCSNIFSMENTATNIYNNLVAKVNLEADQAKKDQRRKEVDAFVEIANLDVAGKKGLKDKYEAAFGVGQLPKKGGGAGLPKAFTDLTDKDVKLDWITTNLVPGAYSGSKQATKDAATAAINKA